MIDGQTTEWLKLGSSRPSDFVGMDGTAIRPSGRQSRSMTAIPDEPAYRRNDLCIGIDQEADQDFSMFCREGVPRGTPRGTDVGVMTDRPLPRSEDVPHVPRGTLMWCRPTARSQSPLMFHVKHEGTRKKDRLDLWASGGEDGSVP